MEKLSPRSVEGALTLLRSIMSAPEVLSCLLSPVTCGLLNLALLPIEVGCLSKLHR